MTWNIDPILFSYGSFSIHWYGLLFATGLYLGYLLMEWIFKKENIDLKLLDKAFVYVIIGLVLGSRLAHVIFYDPQYYLQNPSEIFMVWKGGLASHGGFLGVIIALWLFGKKYNINIPWLLSRGAVAAMIIATFIRIGNFFNSELIGKKTSSILGVVFKRVDDSSRHAVVLYEALLYFIIFLILLYLYKKLSAKTFTNIAFGLTLFLGFGGRIFLEQFKTAQSEFASYLPLSMGQLLSIPFALFGLYLLFKGIKNAKLST